MLITMRQNQPIWKVPYFIASYPHSMSECKSDKFKAWALPRIKLEFLAKIKGTVFLAK